MKYTILAPVVYVLLACICRLNVMTPRTSSVLWRLTYILLASWTGWLAADVLESGAIHIKDAVGVLSLSLYIYLTKAKWIAGVPEVARQKVNFSSSYKE